MFLFLTQFALYLTFQNWTNIVLTNFGSSDRIQSMDLSNKLFLRVTIISGLQVPFDELSTNDVSITPTNLQSYFPQGQLRKPPNGKK